MTDYWLGVICGIVSIVALMTAFKLDAERDRRKFARECALAAQLNCEIFLQPLEPVRSWRVVETFDRRSLETVSIEMSEETEKILRGQN